MDQCFRAYPKHGTTPWSPLIYPPLEETLPICTHEEFIAILTRLQESTPHSEAQSTVLDSLYSIKTSTSNQELEAGHLQETELDFYFGTKFTYASQTHCSTAQRKRGRQQVRNRRSGDGAFLDRSLADRRQASPNAHSLQ